MTGVTFDTGSITVRFFKSLLFGVKKGLSGINMD